MRWFIAILMDRLIFQQEKRWYLQIFSLFAGFIEPFCLSSFMTPVQAVCFGMQAECWMRAECWTHVAKVTAWYLPCRLGWRGRTGEEWAVMSGESSKHCKRGDGYFCIAVASRWPWRSRRWRSTGLNTPTHTGYVRHSKCQRHGQVWPFEADRVSSWGRLEQERFLIDKKSLKRPIWTSFRVALAHHKLF